MGRQANVRALKTKNILFKTLDGRKGNAIIILNGVIRHTFKYYKTPITVTFVK